MNTDLELYRREIRVSSNPLIRLSVIDISPDYPRRTFIFLHGFGGQAIQWNQQIQTFSQENRVIALDSRGHANSDKPGSSYSMEEIQSDILAVFETLKITDSVILIGHSFGGAIATEFALKHPGKISQLILIATAGEFKLNPFLRFCLNLPTPILKLIQPYTSKWLFAPPHVLKAWYRNNLSQWNGWNLFTNLTVPTLIIRGHRDYLFARPQFERIAQLISNSDDVDIGSSGHLVMLERSDAVNRAIIRALDGEKKSWREPDTLSLSKSSRDEIRRERPWVVHYEKGVPYTIGIPRIPLHHLLRSSVRRFPHRTAIIFEGSKLSYRNLNREANKFANALLTLGFIKGTRVALLLPNVPQVVISFFGTLKAGGVVVFVQPNDQIEETIRQLIDSDPMVLVTLNTWAGLAKRIMTESNIAHLILTDQTDYLYPLNKLFKLLQNKVLTLPTALEWNDLIKTADSKSPEVIVSPEDLAVIQYTGGTTNEAKGVMLTHKNLVANTLQTRQWMPAAKEGKELFLCALPFSHSYGLTATLNVPISIGATLILKPTFNVSNILKTVKNSHPTIFPGVPAMYMAINNHKDVRSYNLSSIKACISGSAPLPVEIQETFEKLTKGRLVEGYGLTEASPITHANPLWGLRKVGSIGIPLPSTESCIVEMKNPDKIVGIGQIGELAIRGPQVMLGYWHNAMATRNSFNHGGWLLTGDIAIQDSDGFFQIIARKNDMWYPEKVGKPAFPRDVEEVLYEIPQVKEAVVVAIAGVPIAFILDGKEIISSESILAYCARRLPPYLVPRFVFFVDNFPRTFIGKVLRRELIHRFEQENK